MPSRPLWRVLAVFLVLASLAAQAPSRPAPSPLAPRRNLDPTPPPPPTTLYFPIVSVPSHSYLPIVSYSTAAPANSFLGLNGGPIDGNPGTGAYPGDLAYFPTLRAKSFDWMNVAGVNWYRNYGSDSIVYSWRFVEPARNTYDWSIWDALVQQAQTHNINLLASIGGGTPQWSNGTSDWRVPPGDLYGEPMQSTAWYQYVYNFVQRYDGNGVNGMPGLTHPIKTWEFWNEADLREGWNPPGYPPHEFTGSVQDYVRLRQVAYAAVKAADPTAIVVGPSTAQSAGYTSEYAGGVHWFLWTWPEFVSAGGLNTLDVVSFTHYYSQNFWDAFGEPQFEFNLVNSGRYGKPVWLTETGWSGSPDVNYQQKARSLVQITVIWWAQTWAQHLFWYDFQEQSLSSTNYHKGLIQTTTGPGATGVEPDPLFHPAFRTAELMQSILGAFSSNDHPATLNPGHTSRAYHFSGHGQDVWVAWYQPETGSTTISIDTGGRTVRMISLYGQDLGLYSGGPFTVSADPVYLTTNLDWNPNVDRITGRLHDASQPNVLANGIVGATVAISGPVNATAQTDSDGNYSFASLPDGAYHVSVPGFSTNPASYDLTVGRQIFWGQTSFTVTVPAGP